MSVPFIQLPSNNILKTQQTFVIFVKMEAPLEFITTDSGGKPEVVEEMRKILSNLDDKPLVVVTIAGVYRSGKSYLMNRLAQESGEYFPLGSTVQSKTKGLWAWVGPHPTNKDLNLMLIDTEGLADPEKASKEHDTWVFILALLLSNIFIFNSKGAIDNDSLHNLRLTAELSDHIQTKSSEGEDGDEDEDFLRHFPIFIWAVRDFILKREIDGKTFEDDDDYLDWALTQKRSQKKAVKEANDVKGAIRRFFPEMHCFLFPIPVGDSKLMTNLDTAVDGDLTQEFRDVSKSFLAYVYGVKEPKKVKGRGLNGTMFMALVDNYVNAIRNNSVPCIENAMDMIARQENDKARARALEAYENQWMNVHFPVSDKDLNGIFKDAQKLALDVFSKYVIFDQDQEEARQMVLLLDEQLHLAMANNEKASITACNNVLNKLCEPIQKKMKNGDYMRKGGYQQYQTDMEILQKQYLATNGLGEEKPRVLESFLSKKESERSSILQADKKLGKAEKQAEEERAHREREEQRAKVMEEEMKRTKEESARMEQNFKDGMEKMRQEMKEQADREKEELRIRIQKEQEESLRLIKEGFDKDSQMLQGRIAELTDAMNKKDEMFMKSQQDFQREMMDRLAQQQQQHQQAMQNMIANMPRPRRPGRCVIQ